MGCSTGKIIDEIHDLDLTYNEYSDIKTKINYLPDEDLIESIRYLKRKGIRLNQNNIHLWNVYIDWIKGHKSEI